jgi:hypothetical protein
LWSDYEAAEFHAMKGGGAFLEGTMRRFPESRHNGAT